MSEHVVSVGDSVFDNASYTKGQADVITHLTEGNGSTSRVFAG